MNFHPQERTHRKRGEEGYILLMLLLIVALMMIAMGAILPTIEYQIKRDREEEMIHRGVQYSRAIRAYYKKFGRYPMKIEDLESANNLRFLRKRYKDPTNCKNGTCEDFRLLHFGEVKLTMGGGLAVPQVNAVGSPGAVAPSLAQAANVMAATMATSSGFGGGGASPFAQNTAASADQQNNQNASDSKQPDGSQGNDQSGDSNQPNLNGFSSQTFGGGPIVGVASRNKATGYREFNHKKKYSEWQFIYDPGTDRGGLLMTPNQPPLFPQAGNVNGQNPSGTGNANPAISGANPPGNNPAQPGGDNSSNSNEQNNPPPQQ
jgi:type II secretory pathway pseudopilin PulG